MRPSAYGMAEGPGSGALLRGAVPRLGCPARGHAPLLLPRAIHDQRVSLSCRSCRPVVACVSRPVLLGAVFTIAKWRRPSFRPANAGLKPRATLVETALELPQGPPQDLADHRFWQL